MGKHWLDEAIERYGNDQNNGRDPYPIDRYEYRWGGNGEDTNGNGKREFDCSHFVNRVLRDAGYNIPYQSTSEMAKNYSKYYEEVSPNYVQKGDIVLFNGHIGFYYGKDENGRDLIYHSWGRRLGGVGPTLTPLDIILRNKPVIKILRPKKEFYNSQKQSSVWDFFKNFLATPAYAETTRNKVREGSRRIDPLVIDLDGDGIKLVNINKSVVGMVFWFGKGN